MKSDRAKLVNEHGVNPAFKKSTTIGVMPEDITKKEF